MPTQQPSFCFITATYGADEPHFALLRQSIKYSALNAVSHKFVVHTEDVSAFKAYENHAAQCLSTADILPAEIEKKRIHAVNCSQAFGSRVTTWCGSAARKVGWPQWPRYTGWHMQQIAKLALVATCEEEYAVIVDSDVVITPHAHFNDLANPEVLMGFAQPGAPSSHKIKHWNHSAARLLKVSPSQNLQETYFDTPFIVNVAALKALFAWLENTYGKPWWQVMLDQPPRQWSEFQIYRTFVMHHYKSDRRLSFERPINNRYTDESNNQAAVLKQVDEWLPDEAVHSITIHSYSAGRTKVMPTYFAGVKQRLAQASNVYHK